MKLSEKFSYQGSDVDAVYELLVDKSFRTESCANQGATDYEVNVVPSGTVEAASPATRLVTVRLPVSTTGSVAHGMEPAKR